MQQVIETLKNEVHISASKSLTDSEWNKIKYSGHTD